MYPLRWRNNNKPGFVIDPDETYLCRDKYSDHPVPYYIAKGKRLLMEDRFNDDIIPLFLVAELIEE